jgi:hypothetical protein
MPAQGYPTPPLVGGTSARAAIFEGYVFQSGIHDPEHSKFLTYKYPQYYMTTLLDKLGASEPVAQSTFSWNIMDRTRRDCTLNGSTATGGGSATVVIDTNIAASGNDLGYFQVGDVLRVGATGVLLRVTAIAINSNLQRLSVQKVDQGNITIASDIGSGTAVAAGHVFTAFAEGSTGPDGRLFLPTEDYNYTQILRRSMKVTGSEMSNKTLIGDGKAWYFTVENILMKEFARDREVLVMFGQRGNSGSIKWTRGIFDWVNASGQITTYASAAGVAETDLQSHITKLLPEGGSSELLVLCGSTFLSKVMVALKDYKVHGSTPDSLGSRMAGLDFAGYSFAGKTVYFAYYELFDDLAVLPYVSTPSATAINFRDFSLWLDMGSDDSGRRLITLKYKAHGGAQRKFIHKILPGMMTFDGSGQEGGFASNSFDGVEVQLLSEIGVELRLPNRMGILRANS